MAVTRTFRDPGTGISYTTGVNGLRTQHHLYTFFDFIIAMQKRAKKDSRFKKVQRWVHKVQFRRATLYCYPIDSDDNPLVFPQTLYCDVTEPEITFVFDLTTETLMTKEEWDASL